MGNCYIIIIVSMDLGMLFYFVDSHSSMAGTLRCSKQGSPWWEYYGWGFSATGEKHTFVNKNETKLLVLLGLILCEVWTMLVVVRGMFKKNFGFGFWVSIEWGQDYANYIMHVRCIVHTKLVLKLMSGNTGWRVGDRFRSKRQCCDLCRASGIYNNVRHGLLNFIQVADWRGLKKPAPSDKIIVIFQVAQNPLKFALQTLFPWKKCPCFFSTSGETRQIRSWKSTPSTVFWLSRIEILHCLETDRGVGVGGILHGAILSIFFGLLEKKHGQFHKESTWQISVDSEQLGKLLQICHLGPASLEPFDYYPSQSTDNSLKQTGPDSWKCFNGVN